MNTLKFISLFIFGIVINHSLSAQNYEDSKSMKSQSYMRNFEKVECDDEGNTISGDNYTHKVCLNLYFQKMDSLMNIKFSEYLKEIKNDSIKSLVINYQENWVENRRLQSTIATSGIRGNMFSIVYISNMVFITRKRLEELEYLLK
ncbi:lysozyme inhibitor LprI family protein [uncultured Kordia sp.]|uniref:lysozyme inhibitor LprI family protein n=1 Tax=uncultured Kordia sp. TaxID=507699 RepID=UPI002639DB93|nr:lysozyme inhibitor LprI family protein [uncultured Kordia sp.]